MWPGFDPEIQRSLAMVKTLARLRHQRPTREWPLIFVEEEDALLVVREWPGGEITAYLVTGIRDSTGG